MKVENFHSMTSIQPLSTKELALETIRKLPETASWAEIEERIHFCAAIERGRNDILSGEVLPHEDVKENLKDWITR